MHTGCVIKIAELALEKNVYKSASDYSAKETNFAQNHINCKAYVMLLIYYAILVVVTPEFVIMLKGILPACCFILGNSTCMLIHKLCYQRTQK